MLKACELVCTMWHFMKLCDTVQLVETGKQQLHILKHKIDPNFEICNKREVSDHLLKHFDYQNNIHESQLD